MPLDPRVPNGIAPPPGMPTPVLGQPSGPETPPAMAGMVEQIRNSTATPTEDGGAILQLDHDLPEEDPAQGEDGHDANLAVAMAPGDLARIGQEVLEGFEADLDTCSEYFQTCRDGIALLGLKNESADDPFEGASGAVHPMILIALIRFVANCRGELQPAGGPAKVKTQATPEAVVKEVATRKERFLNYFLTVKDRGFYRDCDAGWLQLGVWGSIFRKVFRDPHTGEMRSRYLTPLQLLVSWHAPDLESAQRATHIDTISTAEAIRRSLNGYYLEGIDFERSNIDADTPEREQRQEVEGRTPSDREEDAEQVHLHQHVLLDPARWGLPEDGPEHLPLPYIVTVDKRTEKVLRIERDWPERDEQFCRRETYAHYLMHPGFGFYGWSLLTTMGSTGNTASTLWRQAINTFMLHTHPGGLRAKGMRPDSENLSVGPGEFAEIDTGGLPIDQAVMPLPYRDIPPSWAPLFETVVSAGQTLGGTQEIQVGEGRQDAPVGTTLAMLEAAIKPTAAVFKRLHEAQGHELRMLADGFGKDPEAVYPYMVDGQKGRAIAADFADNADVFPVSDPNIPTKTERLAQAEGTLQLALQSGGIMDARAAYEDMLATMGRSPQEIARLMPKPNQGTPMDVASEFAMALKGMPLAVGPHQDHYAHVTAHLPLLTVAELPPNVQSALLAHIGEHVASWYRQQAEQACLEMGLQLPPPNQPMPPAIEAAMAAAVARVSDAIVVKLGGMLGQGGDPAKVAEIQFKYEELKFKNADSQRKAQETARQDQTELLKLRQASIDAAADRQLDEAKMQSDLRKTVMTGVAKAGEMMATQQHALGLTNRTQLHEFEMSAADRRHQQETAAAERQHAQGLAEADRRTKGGIALAGHVAGAGMKQMDHAHASSEAAAGRQHELTVADQTRQHEARMATGERRHKTGIAAADRETKTGIAALGAKAGIQKAKLAGDVALKRQDMAGRTAIAAAKLKPKPTAKPAAKKAKKA